MSRATTTSSMQVYDGAATDDRVPGLVVLYAPVGHGGPGLPGAFLLQQTTAVIGREAGVEVCIDVNAVSRRHARMTLASGRWRIDDLGSRNGTVVGGVFVDGAELFENSEIRVGDAVFKLVEAGGRAHAGYRFDGTMAPGAQRLAAQPSALLGGLKMDRIAASLERIAPTTLSVLLQGESGTGKEVAAREVHRLSGRRGAFVAVNCAAIPAHLLESELFGYRRGAFTGADRDKVGLVKAAHGGTLFLDEIGDMPIEAQAKLLRVLQGREVMPVGATSAEPVDVRVVCATHRELQAAQQAGGFRGDLLARVREYAVTLPPLRERKEDVYQLARAMLARHGRPDAAMSVPFVVGLLHYAWPFNVRELEACMRRAVALSVTGRLEVEHLPDELREAMASYGARRAVGAPPVAAAQGAPVAPQAAPMAQQAKDEGARAATPTEEELRELLVRERGNVAAVGRLLGKERMQIHRWMKRYGIVVDDYREG